jgi:plasmid stabilization system protein ParE
MTHRFHAEALAELIAAGRYYNQQVPGLGDDLMNEVESGIRTILSNPTVWRILADDVRRFLVLRFPYGIYYTAESEVVVVSAIKHLHRDPDYWQDRRG